MPFDWHEVSVDHEGARLEGQYACAPRIMVRTTAPFDGIHVVNMDAHPDEEDLEAFVETMLVKIHRTCLWVQEHQEELRARYRPVLEAAASNEKYIPEDQYYLARARLIDDPDISEEEVEQLMEPLEVRWSAWHELHTKTLVRALEELGCDWSHAFWVVFPLAPHFDPARANEPEKWLPEEE